MDWSWSLLEGFNVYGFFSSPVRIEILGLIVFVKKKDIFLTRLFQSRCLCIILKWLGTIRSNTQGKRRLKIGHHSSFFSRTRFYWIKLLKYATSVTVPHRNQKIILSGFRDVFSSDSVSVWKDLDYVLCIASGYVATSCCVTLTNSEQNMSVHQS